MVERPSLQFQCSAWHFYYTRKPNLEIRLARGYTSCMPNRSRKPKQRLDLSQLAKGIVDEATGQAERTLAPSEGKDPAAVALGRKGGLKGGKARAAAMTK